MSVYTPASLLRIAQILRCVSIVPISIFSGALAAPPSRMLDSRASASVWNTCLRGIVFSAICTIPPAFESHGRGQQQHCVVRSLSLCNATAQTLVPLHCCLRQFDEVPLRLPSLTLAQFTVLARHSQ
ncbi:hypothetical protein B0H13DRAFT_2362296 [Mycena leptocephala]|nr:hypothetical protein B0H13DRAFT_2362296 [Mycena leptocephala]